MPSSGKVEGVPVGQDKPFQLLKIEKKNPSISYHLFIFFFFWEDHLVEQVGLLQEVNRSLLNGPRELPSIVQAGVIPVV